MSPYAVHLALLVTCGLTLATWTVAVLGTAKGRERWIRAAELALAVFASAFVWFAVAPDALPLSWLTTLHEGGDSELLRAVRAESTHAGPVWGRWLLTTAMVQTPAGLQPRLDGAVHLNLALLPLVAVGLVAGLRRAGGWPAVAVALAIAWQPVVRLSALSESPAVVCWLWMVLLGTALAAIQGARGWRRWAGALAASGACVLLAATRAELAVVGLAAGLAGMPMPGRRAGVLLLALLFAADRAVLAYGGPTELGWALRAVDVTDPSLLIAPWFWAAAAGPGVAALGLWAAWTAPRALGLPVSLLLLSRLYVAAAHGPALGAGGAVSGFELLRYTGFVAPLLAGAAAVGLGQVAPRWRSWALIAALVPGLPALLQVAPWTRQAALWSVTGPLDADLQREGRFVLAAMRSHPECAIVTRGLAGEQLVWQVGPRAVVSLDELRQPPGGQGSLDAVVGELEGCVLLYAGAQCARPGAACEPGTAPLLAEETGPSQPYVHPAHRPWSADPLVLRLYRLR